MRYYAAAVAGLLVGFQLGRVKGFRSGHDGVIQWMLLEGVEPPGWDPTREWVWS